MNWNSPRTGVMRDDERSVRCFGSLQASRLFRSLPFVLVPWLRTKWLALNTFEGTILETRHSPLHADASSISANDERPDAGVPNS
jgi:hypothetical protein